MSVRARIKILEVKSFQEVEDKVNDFLAFTKEIQHVARINYQLEYNVVIIEYIVFGDPSEEEREITTEIVTEEYYNTVPPVVINPFTYWLKFFFPTL